MGLFQKQECALCGGKAGLLTRYKLAGGEYICGECRRRLSENIDDIGSLTLDDVNEQIRLKEENDRRYESEFHETRRFDFDGRHPMMGVDDDTGEFVLLREKNPDIFRFDQVVSYNVDLNTRPLNEEERKRNSSLVGVLNFFLSDDFGTRFPDLPRCPLGFKVTGMYFNINLGSNPFHAKRLHIDMLPGWSSSPNEIEKAYICANGMYQCLQEYKFGDRAQTRSAAPQSASGDSGSSDDMAEQLKKLKELMDMGVLTQEEFDAKKKQILGI